VRTQILAGSYLVTYIIYGLLIELTKENTMYAAPFKQSSPEGAVRIPPVDGTALRKESWKLGSSPQFYETIN